MPLPAGGGALAERVIAWAGRGVAPEDFDQLAVDIFRFQYEHNLVYRGYCERLGTGTGEVAAAGDIPAVPAAAFKSAALVCGELAKAERVFRTSGTSRGRGRRGAHYLPTVLVYHAVLEAGFRHHLLPDRKRVRLLSLIPPPQKAPDSSLSHMAGQVSEAFGAPHGAWLIGPDGVDWEQATEGLRRAEEEEEPVCLLATSFSLVHLLDWLEERGRRYRLPPGSRVMETGGFKGRSRKLSRAELYGVIEDRLGVPPAWIVNEYGMTELSSQFYDGVAGQAAPLPERAHRPPPWVRTSARHPETLAPLPAGEAGVLRHLDLANVGSVISIQTEDFGVMERDGSFRLHGRAPSAEPRGCSIASDEFLAATYTPASYSPPPSLPPAAR
ncbi:MAG: long-chain fatty acid--CoA ligase [Longimicrobiaceae bacterium]